MSAAAEASLGVIGITVVAHTHMLDAVKAFVIAKKTDAPAGAAVEGTTTFTHPGQFAKWVGGFTALSIVLMMGSDGEQWGQVVTALGVLIATGAVFAYYGDILSLFGVGGK